MRLAPVTPAGHIRDLRYDGMGERVRLERDDLDVAGGVLACDDGECACCATSHPYVCVSGIAVHLDGDFARAQDA